MSKELTTPVVTGIPPDLHPDVIDGDNPAAHLGRRALQGVYENAARILDVEKLVSNKLELAKQARPIFEKTKQRAKEHMTQLSLQYETAKKELDVNLTTGRNNPQAREIRDYVRNEKVPFNELKQFVDAGQREIVGAILGAPPFLSGLTPESYDLLRSYAAERLEPDLHGRISAAELSLSKLMRASQWLDETTTKKLKAWERDSDDAHLAKLHLVKKEIA